MPNFSPELRFLVDWLGPALPGLPPADTARHSEESIWPAALDGQRFLELASNHRVAPLLAATPSSGVPAEVMEKLRGLARGAQIRALRLSGLAVEVVRGLEAASLRALVIKGPATALQLYGDLSLRTYRDLDVWIAPESFAEALKLLQDAGFRPSPYEDARLSDTRTSQHVCLEREGVLLEVHHRLALAQSRRSQLDFEECWSRRAHLAMGGRRVPALDPEHAALLTLTHGSRHRWARLHWLADAGLLASPARASDLRPLLETAARHGCATAVHLGLALAQRTFDGTSGNSGTHVSRGMLQACESLWDVMDAEQHDLGSLPFQLRLGDGPAERMATVRSALFDPMPQDWDALSWIPHRTPVVFSVVRPVRLAGRALQEGFSALRRALEG